MSVTDVVRKGQMNNVDRLLILFRAFREGNEETFYRAAEAIIADELAANHHSTARELQKALSNGSAHPDLKPKAARLASLPRDRRNGDQLISLQDPLVDPSRLILCTETRQKLDRIIEEYRQRPKLAKFGLAAKSKLLFWGPPGCGKTLASHWIAQEIGLPISLVRLNSLISSFVGETASHIQRVFDLASSTPMVLLLDEVDAIGKNRDDPQDVGELKRVVNGLLQAIDAFRPNDSIVIAASNHQYLLDPALWRRFDDAVFFPSPSAVEAKQFLDRLLNGVSVKGSIDITAKSLASLSFAEIERNVVDSLKTMILTDAAQFSLDQFAKEVASFKKENRAARKKLNPLGPKNE